MPFIKGLLLVIEFITAILLVAVILVQKSKDEGLGLAFGAGVGESLFGSRAGNVLTRITIILTMIFLVTTLFIGMISSRVKDSSVVDRLPNKPINTQPLLQTPTPAPTGGEVPAPAESPAPYVPAELPAASGSESAPAPAASAVPVPATP